MKHLAGVLLEVLGALGSVAGIASLIWQVIDAAKKHRKRKAK